jgi:hypothetical protein
MRTYSFDPPFTKLSDTREQIVDAILKFIRHPVLQTEGRNIFGLQANGELFVHPRRSSDVASRASYHHDRAAHAFGWIQDPAYRTAACGYLQRLPLTLQALRLLLLRTRLLRAAFLPPTAPGDTRHDRPGKPRPTQHEELPAAHSPPHNAPITSRTTGGLPPDAAAT